jgi:lysophospholipase L1-like esterase
MKRILVLLLFICCKTPPKLHPYDRHYYDELSRRQSGIFNTLPQDSSDVIFLGTSLTAGYPWSELNPRIKNRGIPGNTSSHMIARCNFKGTTAFIEAGLNDIIAGVPADTFMNNLRQLTGHFKEYHVYTIFPTFGQYADLNGKINLFNDLLRKNYPAAITIPFDSSMTYDGAHPNAKGYQVWKESLQPYIQRISLDH